MFFFVFPSMLGFNELWLFIFITILKKNKSWYLPFEKRIDKLRLHESQGRATWPRCKTLWRVTTDYTYAYLWAILQRPSELFPRPLVQYRTKFCGHSTSKRKWVGNLFWTGVAYHHWLLRLIEPQVVDMFSACHPMFCMDVCWLC